LDIRQNSLPSGFFQHHPRSAADDARSFWHRDRSAGANSSAWSTSVGQTSKCSRFFVALRSGARMNRIVRADRRPSDRHPPSRPDQRSGTRERHTRIRPAARDPHSRPRCRPTRLVMYGSLVRLPGCHRSDPPSTIGGTRPGLTGFQGTPQNPVTLLRSPPVPDRAGPAPRRSQRHTGRLPVGRRTRRTMTVAGRTEQVCTPRSCPAMPVGPLKYATTASTPEVIRLRRGQRHRGRRRGNGSRTNRASAAPAGTIGPLAGVRRPHVLPGEGGADRCPPCRPGWTWPSPLCRRGGGRSREPTTARRLSVDRLRGHGEGHEGAAAGIRVRARTGLITSPQSWK